MVSRTKPVREGAEAFSDLRNRVFVLTHFPWVHTLPFPPSLSTQALALSKATHTQGPVLRRARGGPATLALENFQDTPVDSADVALLVAPLPLSTMR